MAKKRIAFDLTASALADMDLLQEKLGLETRKDLFNYSMTLLDWVCEEIEKGNKPKIVRQDGSEETLMMPAFRKLKKIEKEKIASRSQLKQPITTN